MLAVDVARRGGSGAARPPGAGLPQRRGRGPAGRPGRAHRRSGGAGAGRRSAARGDRAVRRAGAVPGAVHPRGRPGLRAHRPGHRPGGRRPARRRSGACTRTVVAARVAAGARWPLRSARWPGRRCCGWCSAATPRSTAGRAALVAVGSAFAIAGLVLTVLVLAQDRAPRIAAAWVVALLPGAAAYVLVDGELDARRGGVRGGRGRRLGRLRSARRPAPQTGVHVGLDGREEHRRAEGQVAPREHAAPRRRTARAAPARPSATRSAAGGAGRGAPAQQPLGGEHREHRREGVRRPLDPSPARSTAATMPRPRVAPVVTGPHVVVATTPTGRPARRAAAGRPAPAPGPARRRRRPRARSARRRRTPPPRRRCRRAKGSAAADAQTTPCPAVSPRGSRSTDDLVVGAAQPRRAGPSALPTSSSRARPPR